MVIGNYSDFKFENDPSIISASKIIIAAGTRPHRVVLRKRTWQIGPDAGKEEYMTHQENLILDGDTWKHFDFYWGHYFSCEVPGAYELATADFHTRSDKL